MSKGEENWLQRLEFPALINTRFVLQDIGCLTGVESTCMRQGCLKDYFPHTESQLFLASPMLLGRAGVPGREGVTGGLASLVRALLRTPSSRRTNRASSPYKTPARSHNCIQWHTLVYLSLSSTQAIIHDLVSSPSIT